MDEVGVELAALFAKAFIKDVFDRRAKIEAAGPASAARGEIETKEAASVGGLSCSTKVIPPISGSPERKLMRPGECR